MTPSPEMVQVPVDTAYESAPSPSPPLPVNVSVWPYTTVDVPSASEVDCAALAIVTVVFTVVAAAY